MASATTLNGDDSVFQMAAGAAYAPGQIVLIGTEVAIYAGLKTAVSGEQVTMKRRGRFRFPAKSTDTGAVGAKLYWDNTNNELTTTSTSNTLCAKLIKAKASGETTADVYLISS